MRPKVICVTLTLLIVAACAPAAGRPALPYLAKPQEIITAIAQIGPLLEPPSGYNYFSIETIGEGFITLRTDATTGMAVLAAFGGNRVEPIRITVTTLEQGSITQVAISALPRDGTAEANVDRIVQALDQRFRRAPEVLR